MTRTEAAELVAVLMQAYPAAQVGPATSALYERELADLDVAVARAAVQRLVRTSKWFPAVSEIRGTAVDIQRGPRRFGGEAFGDVVAAIRAVGSYRPAPAFTDPLVTECVRLMGWKNLCRGENEAADRARFVDLYEGLQERQQADAVSGIPLPAPRVHGALPWAPPKIREVPQLPTRRGLTRAEREALDAVGPAPRKGTGS